MKIAIPQWKGRVSPVFDVAGNVLLVDVDDGIETGRQSMRLNVDDPRMRAALLAEKETDVLVCGAISWPLEMALSAKGIEVISQTCGEVEHVLAAFIDGRLNQDVFMMPGCCGRRRRLRGRHRRGRTDEV